MRRTVKVKRGHKIMKTLSQFRPLEEYLKHAVRSIRRVYEHSKFVDYASRLIAVASTDHDVRTVDICTYLVRHCSTASRVHSPLLCGAAPSW